MYIPPPREAWNERLLCTSAMMERPEIASFSPKTPIVPGKLLAVCRSVPSRFLYLRAAPTKSPRPRLGCWRFRAARRGGEVQPQILLPGEADELPVVGEGPAVVLGQLVQDHAAGRTHAERMLEEIDEFLR